MKVSEFKEWLNQFPDDFDVRVIVENENTYEGGEFLSFKGIKDVDYSIGCCKTLYLGN